MTLKYVGSRAFNHRLAEFRYEDHEEERFMKIAEAFEEAGYKIDTGVQNWATIKVDDKDEFDEIKELFKDLKRKIKL